MRSREGLPPDGIGVTDVNPELLSKARAEPKCQSLSCGSRESNADQVPKDHFQSETMRLDSSRVPTGCRANATLYSDHLSSVNTCVYEPSAFRVLVNWPRAPMYLPVPPKIARTTGWPASNSPAVGG